MGPDVGTLLQPAITNTLASSMTMIASRPRSHLTIGSLLARPQLRDVGQVRAATRVNVGEVRAATREKVGAGE